MESGEAVSTRGDSGTWLGRLNQVCDQGAPCVLVTIVETHGSTPREVGAKMVVARDKATGTIGGGHLEYQATGIARAMLGDPSAGPELQHFALGPSLGQCCGGTAQLLFEPIAHEPAPWRTGLSETLEARKPAIMVTAIGEGACAKLVVTADATFGSLGSEAHDAKATDAVRGMLDGGAMAYLCQEQGWLFEPVRPESWDIVLFGAGHVGKALIQVLGALPCRITWVDGRAELFPEAAPDNVRIEHTDWPIDLVGEALPGAAFLVMTHSHALDLRICEKVLQRNDFSYLGLIGSATKRARFVKRFRARGIPGEVIERMICPIGIAGIDGKNPGTIAVAVAAQLLLTRAAAAEPATSEPPAAATATP